VTAATQIQQASDRMKRVFIVGCPRSGTTWTGLLLAQHPEVRVCQQVGAVWAMESYHRWWSQGEKKADHRYISSLVRFGQGDETPRFEQLMTRDEVVGVCRSIADQTYAHATAGAEGCRAVVDKTPENVRFPDFLGEVFPDAYYLHLIRDPRSTFASHRHGSKDMGATFPTDPKGGAKFWVNDVRRGRRLRDLVPNYRELRYETLKANGREELTALLEWLGLTVDPAWVDAVLAKTSVEKLQKSQGTPKSFFRAGSATGWRAEISQKDLHALEYHARDLMLELGYTPEHPDAHRKPAGIAMREALGRIRARARAVAG
jgi:hypothetical protein